MSINNSPILVLCATGSVGSHVVDFLKHKPGVNIRAATRDPSKCKSEGNIQYVAFDPHKPETLVAAFEGVKTMFFAQAPIQGSLEQAKIIADYAKKAGVKYAVKLSAAVPWEYIIGRVHLGTEDYVRELGIGLISLRPTSFNSNFLRHVNSIQTQNTFYTTIGDTPLNRIDNQDIGEAAANILIAPEKYIGRSYTLAGELLTEHQAAELLSKHLGRKINYVCSDDESYRKVLLSLGLSESHAHELVDIFISFRSGSYNLTTNDVELLTGHKPRPLEDWIKENIHAFQPKS